MRRFIKACLLFCLILALAVSVHAASAVSAQQTFATVSADGSCQVSMAVTLRLEQTEDKLLFPVPAQAVGVSVNGSRVTAAKDGQVRNINLSRVIGNMVGEFSVNIQYTLRDVIHTTEEGILQMQVPLLCGFSHPVEQLSFSVTLPGEVPVLPSFSSGYHQAGIEEHLTFSADGAVITGSSVKAMKDRETLVMTMAVSEEMFPQSLVKTQSVTTAFVGIWCCAGVAFAYWLCFLRSFPWRRKRCPLPPEGLSAGHLGCVAYMQGVDLTMTVFTWARLGYILIRTDRRGGVRLEKRMEMGNERSDAERRVFDKLFGRKNLVDTQSYQYAMLQRSVAKRPAQVQELLKKHTGNPKLLRFAAAGVGAFAGAGVGLSMGNGAVLQGFLVALLGLLGLASGWVMLDWAVGIGLRQKNKLWRSLLLGAVWLLLGLLAGEGLLALLMVAVLLVLGILYVWSGRRTALGRQSVAQVLGLQRYLRRPRKEQLQQRLETDPGYFFDMLPYAMALGVDRAFARSFRGVKQEACPWIDGVDRNLTAMGWCNALRQVAQQMDRRAQQLPMEKLLGMLHSMTRR